MENPSAYQVTTRKDELKRYAQNLDKASVPGGQLKRLALRNIIIGPRIIPADKAVIVQLEASILRTGRLTTPLLVYEKDGKYPLIDGLNRYHALRALGHTHVDAIVIGVADNEEAVAFEAICNRHRRPKLSALDRALSDVKILHYGASKVPQVETPRGGRQPRDKFHAKTARELGVSVDQMTRSSKIAKIVPSVQEQIRREGLEDNQRMLLEIATSGDDATTQFATLARLQTGIKGGRKVRQPKAVKGASLLSTQVPQRNEIAASPTGLQKSEASDPSSAQAAQTNEAPAESAKVDMVTNSDERFEKIKGAWAGATSVREELFSSDTVHRARFVIECVINELFPSLVAQVRELFTATGEEV